MAENAKEYTVSLEKLSKTVEQLNTENKQTEAQMKALKKQYDAGKISVEQYSKAVKQLQAQQGKNNKQIQNLNKELGGKFTDIVNTASQQTGQLAGALGGMGVQIGGLTGMIGGLGNALKLLLNPVTAMLAGIGGLLSLFIDWEEVGNAISSTFRSWKIAWYDLTGQTERLNKELGIQKKTFEDIIKQLDLIKQKNDALAKVGIFAQSNEEKQYLVTGGNSNLEEAVKLNDEIFRHQLKALDAQKQIEYHKSINNKLSRDEKELAEANVEVLNDQQNVVLKQWEWYETRIKTMREEIRMQKELNQLLIQQAELHNKIAEIQAHNDVLNPLNFSGRIANEKAVYDIQQQELKNREEQAKVELESIKRRLQSGRYQFTAQELVAMEQQQLKLTQEIENIKSEGRQLDIAHAQRIKNLEKEKADYEQKQLEELQDLQDSMIDNQYEKQKKQIQRTRDRAIEALKKVYQDPSVDQSIRTMAEKIATQIGSVKIHELDVVDTQQTVETFRKLGADITSAMREALFQSGTVSWFDLIGLSDEEIKDKYNKLNSEQFANTQNYKNMLVEVSKQLKYLEDYNPKPDWKSIIDADQYLGLITKVEAEREKESKDLEDIKKQQEQLTKNEDRLYTQRKRDLEAIHTAETKRVENLHKEGKISKADYDRSIEAEQAEHNKRMDQLDKVHKANEDAIKKNADAKRILRTKQTEEQIYAIRQKYAQSFNELLSETASILGSIADIQEQNANDEHRSAKQREKDQRKALNLQIAQVWVNSALSMAQAISKATSSSATWIDMLVAIVASVAAVTSGVASTKSLLAKKNSGGYAEGGLIGDQTKRNSRKDDLTANVSAGEYIINSNATADNLPLLDTLNYSGRGGFARQMALALRSMPAPRVDVETIDRVSTQWNSLKVYSHL